jgi:hypothetical protein
MKVSFVLSITLLKKPKLGDAAISSIDQIEGGADTGVSDSPHSQPVYGQLTRPLLSYNFKMIMKY